MPELLKEAIRIQDEVSPSDDLFDLLPLSSLESTPPCSPILQATSFPKYYDSEELEGLDGGRERAEEHCGNSSGVLQEQAYASKGPKKHGSASATLDDASADDSRPSPISDAKAKRKKRCKNQSRKNRKKRCEETKRDNGTSYGETAAREESKKKYLNALQPLYTSAQTTKAAHVKTGYNSHNNKEHMLKTFMLEELVGENSKYKMVLFEWDGKTPTGLVDQDGRMFGIVAGHPTDSKWQKLSIWAAKCLEEARLRCHAAQEPQQYLSQRRGAQVVELPGVFYKAGRLYFMSVLSTYAPDLHAYYKDKLTALHDRDPSLKPTFPSTVFTATTYNLGPQTVCYPHTDFSNLAFGWCSITALSSFDPKKGGHLVLWECGLVIEFPPGSTVLIPSALIHHSNTPISPTEKRYSFMQYSAGALFRWVDHNFQKTNDYHKSLSREALQELDEKNKNRWAYGLTLLPRLPSVSTS
ncbi:hypothetical protein NLJ89_g9852 [Agrocybe chaxingu]|uniref:Uncharacterized protein n=1 Tax=Agrocybe chaxingu TaxID=84603 RepID=A0A9W8JZ86_9AGAR|nr:hypothetical protein NLJ89_g9852 [Agrocybe chaxingu]